MNVLDRIFSRALVNLPAFALSGFLLGFSAAVGAMQEKPEDVAEDRWQALKAAVQQAKLLPDGVGGVNGSFGQSVSISGNRALVGAWNLNGSGAALVMIDDGTRWREEAVLLPSDGESSDGFGYSVSLSGNRALIGALFDDDNGSASGSAYVFDFDGTSWGETTKLKPADGAAADQFGHSVSLEGTRALIGVVGDDDNGNVSGSAYVFDFDGANWSETDKLTPADGAGGDFFGWSVSLAGARALVGAYGNDDNGSQSGSAYVFEFDGIGWLETAKLTASDGSAGAEFGASVHLDIDRAFVGAPFDSASGTPNGAVYDFVFSGSWVEREKLIALDGADGDQFGLSIRLEGPNALIGAPFDDDNGGDSGSVYVFELQGARFRPVNKLTAFDGQAGDQFGTSVSLDGTRSLFGAPLDDDFFLNSGSAYVFDSDGVAWSQSVKLTAGDGAAGDEFGAAVSVSGDRALIGAPRGDDNGTAQGVVHVFDFDGSGWSRSARLTASDGAAGDDFGASVSLDGNRALVGAPNDTENGVLSGSAYVFDLAASTWSETAKLVASDGMPGDQFGWSVSLSGDRVLIGAPGEDFDSPDGTLDLFDQGAVYIFDLVDSAWSQSFKLTTRGDEAMADQGDLFGTSVSLSDDRALVGAPQHDVLEFPLGIDSGAAFLFDFDGSSWVRTARLTAFDDGVPGDEFGTAVSLSGDRALVGAPLDDDNGTASGSAYVFEGPDWNSSLPVKLIPGDGAAEDFFGGSVSLSGDRALVGTSARRPASSSGRLVSAYTFERSGSDWLQSAKLSPDDGAAIDRFASSLSLSDNRLLIGAPRNGEQGASAGAAYVLEAIPVPPPVARADQLLGNEDDVLSGNVLFDNGDGADQDPFSNPLTVTEIDGVPENVGNEIVLAPGGRLTVDESGALTFDPDGQFDALPVGGFASASFEYSISNGFASDTATVDILILGVNDPPSSAPDAFATDEDQPAFGNVLADNGNGIDSDPDGDPLVIQSPGVFAAAGIGGSVDIGPEGGFIYSPPLNLSGIATFDYVIADPFGATSAATVTIFVLPVNDAPTFTATDPASILEDAGPQSIANWAAFDPGAPNELQDLLGYTVSNVGSPELFVAGPAVDSSGNLSFTPSDDAFGTSTFDVIVQDDGGVANGGTDTSDPQTFTITVDPVNDAPSFAFGGNVTEIEDGDYAEPWANSINPGPANESGQSVSFMTTVTSNPGLFAVAPSVDPAGTLSFTPVADTTGSATIEVVAMDDGGTENGGIPASDPAAFTIDVIAAADLTIDKTSGSFFTPPGGTVSYMIVVSNPGPSNVTQATVTDVPPSRLGNVTWTCTPNSGAACNPSGSVEIDELVNLPEGSSVTFELEAELTDTLNDPITNTAGVTNPVGVLELAPENNTDSDTDLVGLFADGMETGEP